MSLIRVASANATNLIGTTVSNAGCEAAKRTATDCLME